MNIPVFPAMKPVVLEDKKLVDEFLRQFPPDISELTFTNIFGWRKADSYCLSVLEDCLLVVSARVGKAVEILEPVGEKSSKLKAIKRAFSIRNDSSFIRLSQGTASYFKDDSSFILNEDEKNFDYVYSSDNLIELSGKLFDAKRNFIKRFKEACNFEYKKITPDNVEACLSFEEEWCLAKDCKHTEGLLAEREAMEEMLKNFDALKITGGMIEIDGKIGAVSLGERLNPNTFVVHIEKANGGYIGIYQVINQMFCANEAKGFAYVNREQDLGVPGLRKAKQSYHPHHMVKKYTLRLLS